VQVKNYLTGKIKFYKTSYRDEVAMVLGQIWGTYGHTCSKHLQPFLPETNQCWNGAKKPNFPKKKELLL